MTACSSPLSATCNGWAGIVWSWFKYLLIQIKLSHITDVFMATEFERLVSIWMSFIVLHVLLYLMTAGHKRWGLGGGSNKQPWWTNCKMQLDKWTGNDRLWNYYFHCALDVCVCVCVWCAHVCVCARACIRLWAHVCVYYKISRLVLVL